MKLTSVHVEGCGRFGTPSVLEGLGPGVNILSARNEAGKSTLFRAIRTCLFERHSSRNRDIAALATEGLSIPVSIAVGFDHNGQSYEIRKSFLKGVSASLKRGGVEIARNAEADELVWDLLGLAPKSSKSFDEATYGVLWVEQGQSFLIPEPSEGAASALNDVIQQEVGTLVGGERARSLLSHVKEELARYLTDTGRVKANGPLDAAEKQCEALSKARENAESQLLTLNEDLDELGRLQASAKRAADPAASQRLKHDLAEAQRKLQAAQAAALVIRQLATEEKQAAALLKSQDDKLKALEERRDGIDRNRIRIKDLGAALKPLDEQEIELARRLGEQQHAKSQLDAEERDLEAEDLLLQRFAAHAQKSASRSEWATRLAALRSIEKRFAESLEALQGSSVDEAAVKALEAVEREADLIAARREAASARLTIEMKGNLPVTVNGAAVAGNLARAVTEPMTVEIGGEVAITISPPIASASDEDRAERTCRDKLKALLARHAARDAEDLRHLRAQRTMAEDAARQLRAEYAAFGLKDVPPAEAILKLESDIKLIDEETKKLLQDTGGTVLPLPAEIEERREAMQERRAGLRAAHARHDAAIRGQNAARARILSERGTLAGQIKEIDSALRNDLALLPDDRRDAMLAACGAERDARASEHRDKALLLAERRETAPEPDEIERLGNQANRLAAAQQNAAREIEDLNQKIARLEGQIENAGGQGLGEHAAQLREQQDLAQREWDRIAERVEVLKLLRNAVEQSYARRRDQLHAPLRRHLKPFLNDVFPQAEIDLGENFAVQGLKRSGPAAELFGRLSHGTQEQIAVLVRLAMGAMICEKGPDVPVILDDALVFSDDDRIEQMFDAINRAGRNQQVIVLTCRARSFASLGGRTLHISGR